MHSPFIKEEFQKIAGEPSPPCYCGNCKDEDDNDSPLLFRCEGCGRMMFNCYGQADRFFDYCDFCAVALEEESPEIHTTDERTREKLLDLGRLIKERMERL
ncbi:hypothetical protein V0288_23825 [Pannus brasiliensis CCIBt3594]|uniref:Uncharacterized protein n=1 Tax=Pannus brasiliensis CCIBt3594 TaxID=1427578 RepID=A0AAW9QTC8_9CHRO